MNKIRMKVKDVAFAFRMGAGFAGDVNRTHPASITACLIDTTLPPTAYGQAVLLDTTSHNARRWNTGDAAGAAYGVTVRPYPTQQASASNYGEVAFGSVAPPVTGIVDILMSGYIMVNLPFGGTTVKGGTVYVRVAATSGNHIIGSFEAASDGSNNVAITGCTFNGSPDANGNVEIAFNI